MSDKERISETDTFEENQQLDDIVLEQYKRRERVKRYTIFAILLALFLAILVGTKMVLSSSTPPQDQLVESVEEEMQKGEDTFEEVPILSEDGTEEETNIEDIVQELKKKEIVQQQRSIQEPSPKEPPQQQKSIQPTPDVHKPSKTAKTQPKQKSPAKRNKSVQRGHYYIQVGAFVKSDPDRSFLRTIKAKGFSYTIKTLKRGGQKVKKVLIGPYTTKKEARQMLQKVRKSIVSGAFIVRL